MAFAVGIGRNRYDLKRLISTRCDRFRPIATWLGVFESLSGNHTLLSKCGYFGTTRRGRGAIGGHRIAEKTLRKRGKR